MLKVREVPEEAQRPIIETMARAGDWPGLVRFSIAIHSRYAAIAASNIEPTDLRSRANHGKLASSLKQFADAPYLPWTKPANVPKGDGVQETVEILELHHRAIAFEMEGINHRKKFTTISWDDSLGAAVLCSQLSSTLQDSALCAFYELVLSRLCTISSDWQTALTHVVKAVQEIHPLVRCHPAAYGASGLMALTNGSRIANQLGLASQSAEYMSEAMDIAEFLYESASSHYAPQMCATTANCVAAYNSICAFDRALPVSNRGVEVLRGHPREFGDQLHAIASGVYLNRAYLLEKLGDLDGAWESSKLALGHAGVDADDREEEHTEDLALGYVATAKFCVSLGRVEEALNAAEHAMVQLVELAKLDSYRYRGMSAQSAVDVGYLCLKCGSVDRAIAICELASGWVDAEARQDSGRYGHSLVKARHGIALGYMAKCEESGIESQAATSPMAKTALDSFQVALKTLFRLLVEGVVGLEEEGGELCLSFAQMRLRMGDAAAAKECLDDVDEALDRRAEINGGWYKGVRARWHYLMSETHRQLGEHALECEQLEMAATLVENVSWDPPSALIVERLEVEYRRGRFFLEDYRRRGEEALLGRACKHLSQGRSCGEALLEYSRDPSVVRQAHLRLSRTFDALIDAEFEFFQIHPADERINAILELAEAERARFLRERLRDISDGEEEGHAEAVPLKEAIRARRVAALALVTIERSWDEIAPSLFDTGDDLEPQLNSHYRIIEAARHRFRKAYELEMALRESIGESETTARTEGHDSPKTLQNMRRIISSGAAIVHYHLQAGRGLATVVTADNAVVINLPNARAGDIHVLADTWNQAYESSKQGFDPRQDHKVDRVLSTVLWEISERVLHTVAESIPEQVSHVSIIPNRSLHLFPLHACGLRTGGFAIDRWSIAYSPSVTALVECSSGESCVMDRLLVLETSGQGFRDDPARVLEVQMLGTHPGFSSASVVPTVAVAPREALGLLQTASHVHFSGHACFSPRDQLNSRLSLGTSEEVALTLEDIYAGATVQRGATVVLNACETGRLNHDPLDDFLSFSAGFLYAGAQTVLSTHWAVLGLPSLLLAERFYGHLESNWPVSIAFRESLNWLRGKQDSRGECLQTWSDVSRYIATRDSLSGVERKFSRDGVLKYVGEQEEQFPEEVPFRAQGYWAPFYVSGGVGV